MVHPGTGDPPIDHGLLGMKTILNTGNKRYLMSLIDSVSWTSIRRENTNLLAFLIQVGTCLRNTYRKTVIAISSKTTELVDGMNCFRNRQTTRKAITIDWTMDSMISNRSLPSMYLNRVSLVSLSMSTAIDEPNAIASGFQYNRVFTDFAGRWRPAQVSNCLRVVRPGEPIIAVNFG